MTAINVDNGKQRTAVQTSQATSGSGPTYSTTRHIQTMAVDDQSSAFLSTDVSLNRSGGLTVSNEYDAAYDATPTRSGNVVTSIMTIPTGSGNFTIRRISEHDNAAGSVDATTATLCDGIDGQSLAKTSDFSLTITLTKTYG